MFTKNSFNGKADPVADAIKAIAESDYALKVEALKGDQVKLDKNKNNKLDAQDFKILRGKKKVEEAEEKPRSAGSVFDKDVAKSFEKKKPGESTGHEAKKTSTGTQYTKKAPVEESLASFKDKLKAGAKKVARVMGGPDDEGHKKDLQKKMGIPQTGKPNHAKYNEEVEFDLESIDPALVEEFMQTEEFEQLDELSKGTLASYVKKSSDDLGYHAARVAGGVKDVARHGGKNTPIGKELQKDVEKSVKIRDKRSSGIDKAATKLSKEEVEEISELKKSTLASYVNKASVNAVDNMVKAKEFNDIKDRVAARGPSKVGDNLIQRASTHADKSQAKANKRVAGMLKANKKLREDSEQLDELSKDTMKSYQDKAMKTPPSKNGNWVSRIVGVARSAEKMKKKD